MTIKALVERVLTALYAREPHVKVVLATTGGGSSAAEMLFRLGSSSTLLNYSIPYHRSSLRQYLAEPKDLSLDHHSVEKLTKFCSVEIAERMALAAYKQTQEILKEEAAEDTPSSARQNQTIYERVMSGIGIGCTASLATSVEKKGPHQCFLSICRTVNNPNVTTMDFFQTECQSYHINFDKKLKRTRSEEDTIVSQWMVYLLASTAKVDEEGCQQLYQALLAQHGEQDFIKPIVPSSASISISNSSDPLLSLVKESTTPSCKSVCFFPKGTFGENDGPLAIDEFPFQGIILPGSFNPVHKGHFELATAAQKLIQEQKNVLLPIAFEIAISNADKGVIDMTIIKKRVDQFLVGEEQKWPVIVSTATLFLQKARLFKGVVFVIGADTAVRIVDKKYYNQDEHEMILALNKIDRNNCLFVVAGRFDEKIEKRFISAEEVMEKVPKVFQHLFLLLKEDVYRNDLSSTQLRQQ